jgi:peroxiredoxin
LDELPTDLPQPIDDGACDHLVGMTLPNLSLASTARRDVNLAALGPGLTVVYCYPLTGLPGENLPEGWDAIPGARGCTPEACAFRESAAELTALGVRLFGLSTQATTYQREMVARLHLPFEVLSDADLRFAAALQLPTFAVDGMRLIKRLTLVIRDGAIQHVFYPVFPPDRAASEVVGWLRHARSSGRDAQ